MELRADHVPVVVPGLGVQYILIGEQRVEELHSPFTLVR
jgi:hypothetical protein